MKDSLILETPLDCSGVSAGFRFIMDTVCSVASPEDVITVDDLKAATRVGINVDEGIVLGTAQSVYDRCFKESGYG